MKHVLTLLIYLALLLAPAQQASDLQAQLDALQPGDTLVLAPGVHSGFFVANASCTVNAPCRIEATGATIDGGLRINASDTQWFDLEVRNTSWTTRVLTTTATQPIGIEIFGARTKIVNCNIHDTNGGIYAWSTAIDAEIYGCRIANVGYKLGATGHGHALYLQNDQGTKLIRNNIILPGDSGWGVHAYGQAGKLTGFAFERNVQIEQTWLLGGSQPVDRAVLDSNVTWGGIVDLGYWGATHNQAITITNNLFASTMLLSGFQRATVSDNTFGRMSDQARIKAPGVYDWQDNTYLCKYTTCPIQFTSGGGMDAPTWQVQTGFDTESSFVYGGRLNRTIVYPNEYDAGRATVVALNENSAASVVAPVAGRYVNAQNTSEAVTLTKGAPLPMTGWTVAVPYGASAPLKPSTFPQFGIFLVEPI